MSDRQSSKVPSNHHHRTPNIVGQHFQLLSKLGEGNFG